MPIGEKTISVKGNRGKGALSADLKNYLDMLQERIIITDLQGNLIFQNKAVRQDVGKKPKDVPLLQWSEEFQVRDAKTQQPLAPEELPVYQVLATGNDAKRELSMKLNNKEFFVRVEAKPRRGTGGRMIGCIATYTDISLEVAQRNQIRQNETQLRTLLERINEGVLHINLAGEILFVNDKFCQMVGHKRRKLVGKNILDAVAMEPASLEKAKQRLADAANGLSERYELKILTSKGDTRIFEVSGSPLYDSNGHISSVFSLHTDITVRRRANDNLRQSEARYRNLVEHMDEGLVLLDHNGHISFANQRFCELIGHGLDAVQGAHYGKLLDINELPGTLGNHEMQLRHQNGDWRWHRVGFAQYQTAKDQSASLMLMHSDITVEKKFAEERERLLITAESTSDFVAMVDYETNLLYINRAARKALDIPLDKPVEQLIMTDYYTASSLDKLFNEAVPHAVKHDTWQGEMSLVDKSGKKIPISQVIISKKNAHGRVEYFASIGRDITESKKLQREMAILARMPEEQPNPQMRIASDGMVAYANPASQVLLRDWKTKVGKPVPARWKEAVTEVLQTGRNRDFEVVCGKKVFELRLVPVVEYDYVNLLANDITHRKLAEEKLKASEQKYRAVVEDQTELISRYLEDGTITFVNSAYCRYFGHKPGTVEGRNIFDFVPKSALKEFRARLRKLTQKNPSITYSIEVREPGMPIRWQMWTDRAVFDEAGAFLEYQSVAQDITTLKENEQELQQQKQSLQTRLRLKESISSIATRFINLPYHQIDNAIRESLEILGELTGVDRVVINLLNKGQFLPKYYWLRQDNQADHDIMKLAHPLNLDTWEAKQMQQTGYLYLKDVSQIPEGSYLKYFVERASIKSSMILPLQSKGTVVGFMSLTSTRQQMEWEEEVIALLRITAQTISSALERKNTEALLNFTLQFENIITIISANFINILPKDINDEITASLRYVGEFLGIEQGYIFMANSTGRRFKLSHYWLENDMEPNKELVERAEAQKHVWIYRQIKKDGVLSISTINDIPEEAAGLKEVFEMGGIKSMVGIPIMSKGVFHGLLLFASFKRERFWQEEAIPLLKILSQIVANALERKRSEEELAETREMYRTLARNIPKAAVFLYDKDLRYRLVEGAELENQGYDKPSMEGRVITQVLSPSSLKTLEPLYRDALQGKEHIMEREFNKKHYLIHFLPVRNEQGEIYAGMVMSMDITDLKETQRKLEQHTAELMRSNEDLELFAYAASHDLQEPLRMVSSYIHLIKRKLNDQLQPDTLEFMEFAVDGVKRMQDLINDLLEYSRVDRKGNTFRIIDLNKVVEFVRINLQRIIAEKGATVESAELPEIVADQPQMISLFQNLMENAIKFHGQEPPLVQIGYTEEKDKYRFYVKDNGIGIDQKYFDRIFIIFQRLNSRSEYSGTGIGLAICKKIVERHGGKLWVESSPGQGTTFYFETAKSFEPQKPLHNGS